MINESSLIERELVIRDLRISSEVSETRKASIRWLALALGIINPGESRQMAIAVLDSLIEYQFIKKIDPTAKDLIQYISEKWGPINEKTLRYHLLRFKKMGLIDNKDAKFFFTPPEVGDRFDIDNWVNAFLTSYYKPIANKISAIIKNIQSKS